MRVPAENRNEPQFPEASFRDIGKKKRCYSIFLDIGIHPLFKSMSTFYLTNSGSPENIVTEISAKLIVRADIYHSNKSLISSIFIVIENIIIKFIYCKNMSLAILAKKS